MSSSKPPIIVIRTKLYPPPIPAKHINREALEADLEAGVGLPLTVVSAPAGYGKSTLISHWMQNRGAPGAWLSLDESDSDIRVFLTYFVAALRTVSAGACEETFNMINAESLPHQSVIVGVLSNDIDELNEHVVLALDDYHRIREPAIHSILDSLLAHPPRYLHLALLSRRDPQLSLASLRAGHLCTEIRMRELVFSSEETAAYFEDVNQQPVDMAIIDRLQDITEGWLVGLRFASLALQHHDDIESFLRDFGAAAVPLREYMIVEVLSRLPPRTRTCLLNTSILDRFNASLCAAVCYEDAGDSGSVISGKNFIETLENSGLFIIALDAQRNWFRFHHLFGDLLNQQIEESLSREEILKLHQRASRWLTENACYEEAIRHALAAHDVTGAARIVRYARHALMNRDRWHQLELWLKLFSHKAVEQQPQLLVLRCWLDVSLWYRPDALAQDIEKTSALLECADIESSEVAELETELLVLRSTLAYWSLNPSLAASLTEKALADLPEQQEYVRSVALMYRAVTYQLDGESQQAELLQKNHFYDEQCNSPASQARIIQSLCFVHWCEADTRKLVQSASKLLQTSLDYQLQWSHSFARYFLGLAHYERNELSDAVEQLEIVVDEPYRYPIQNVTHCSFLLGLCYQALGFPARAREVADSIARLTFDAGNGMFIDLAAAFQAELDLQQGHIAQADQWARNFVAPAAHVMIRYFNAELTYTRILMAQDQPAAAELLDSMHKLLNRIHHRRLMVDVLGMKALLADAAGDAVTAVSLLQDAVHLGQPGQLIRPLVNLGPELLRQLDSLDLDQEGRQYAEMLQSALTGNSASKDSTIYPPMLEALSRRELQVLDLFAKHLSNKEIAQRLNISTGTVKRHAHNIISKLGVSDRYEAVTKATDLGIPLNG